MYLAYADVNSSHGTPSRQTAANTNTTNGGNENSLVALRQPSAQSLILTSEVVISHYPINSLRGLELDFVSPVPRQSRLHRTPPRPAYISGRRMRILRPIHLPVSDYAVQESSA